MFSKLDRDHHKALPRPRQIQSSAPGKECARLKKPLQNSARDSTDWSRSVGQWRNQHLKIVEITALPPGNLPISTSARVEDQLFPLPTRGSNSK